jgi:predicted nucleic acid-binding protein
LVARFHVDTDFLVYALATSGPERMRLRALAATDAVLEISAIAWYEFCRGPRTPEQVAVARSLFGEVGVIPFTEDLAEVAADRFRQLGSPRKRAADIAIAATALHRDAVLLTRNGRDFAGVEGLRVEEPAEGS